MGAKPKAMEDIRSVIRLHKDGFSNYAINEHKGISLPTIRKYLNRLKELDFTGEQLLALDNQAFSQICFPEKIKEDIDGRLIKLHTHFEYAERELTKTGVTRQLLWIEYKEQHPDGYNYSQYCYYFPGNLHRLAIFIRDLCSVTLPTVGNKQQMLGYLQSFKINKNEIVQCFHAILSDPCKGYEHDYRQVTTYLSCLLDHVELIHETSMYIQNQFERLILCIDSEAQ